MQHKRVLSSTTRELTMLWDKTSVVGRPEINHTHTLNTVQSSSCYRLNCDPAAKANGSPRVNLSLGLKNTDRCTHTDTHPHRGNQVTQSEKCSDQENPQSFLLHLLYYTQYCPAHIVPGFFFFHFPQKFLRWHKIKVLRYN